VKSGSFFSIENAVPLMRHWLNPSSAALSFVNVISIVSSTSFIERQNLTMRMSMRRFTRLTNGFSKTLANHTAAVALHDMHYNVARVHRTLRVTPAMEAALANHVWSIEEIIDLLDRAEEPAA
jgi:3-polyprenyl-4-hydroxybenzoate decarboxylase